MTEGEDFLTRWSRRKRGAVTDSGEKAKPAAAPEQRDDDAAETASVSKTASVSLQNDESGSGLSFDLSKLPSLDSIGPATDIRLFLQPGVPEALSRAALRRAWAADPGIRDFIGLAENSWDFTAPNSMAGFGALDPSQVPRLLANLFSDGAEDNKTDSVPTAASPEGIVGSDQNPSAAEGEPQLDETADESIAAQAQGAALSQLASPALQDENSLHRTNDIALQNSPPAENIEVAPQHRQRGRALPE